MTGRLSLIVFVTSFASAIAGIGYAQAEEKIYSLGDEAVCRDANGKILQPRITPGLPVVAEKTRFGMIRVKNDINGLECFFYIFEVSLDPTNSKGAALCPDASVGQDKSSIAGTREACRMLDLKP